MLLLLTTLSFGTPISSGIRRIIGTANDEAPRLTVTNLERGQLLLTSMNSAAPPCYVQEPTFDAVRLKPVLQFAPDVPP